MLIITALLTIILQMTRLQAARLHAARQQRPYDG
jgi:hypothetical protein